MGSRTPRYSKEVSIKTRQETVCSPRGKLHVCFSARVKRIIATRKEGRCWETLVGYSLDELKTHLEKQFKDGTDMGQITGTGWHIDHIIPVSVFNFLTHDDIDFKRCWSLSNLQPLWAKENMSKHNKISKPFQPSLAFAA